MFCSVGVATFTGSWIGSDVDDRLRLTVLGSSPAVPNPGGACSGYLLELAGRRVLVDCGHGVVGILRTVTEIASLDAVLVSHMHPDHIFDLVPLTYGFMFGRLPPIPLLLPPGGYSTLEALQEAVGLGDQFFKRSFAVEEYSPDNELETAGLAVTFAPTRHFIPGYAMRFTVGSGGGGDILYTADTGWSEDVLRLARGAELALVESTVLRYESDYEATGHLTPELAGELARAAGVRRLLLTHYARTMGERMRAVAQSAFGGPVELAVERETYLV